ncbi:Macrolide export ATP-binding/permease protein MacB [Porphyromonas macacae]|uniref:Macrolide export ATP-binding/permease protein MacB n=2 Tax=Porphyromonas macacae TaxID=28115 RepID=A0A379E9U7_9PORP|nr:ABC transporter permease [Porphyromonas macacae]SUB89445.1 Macrolide export ATP-binding/permease protein MacB [Porphyromonas macacae]
MNYVKQSWRRLGKKGEKTFIKILSLGLGLSFGFLMLSEVLYYYSFNSFYPNAGRTYLTYVYGRGSGNEQADETVFTNGAVAPGLQSSVSGIEAATRFRVVTYKDEFITEEKTKISAMAILADEQFFDVLGRPVLSGEPRSALSRSLYCMISDKTAKALGGNPVGKTIIWEKKPDQVLTIAGVFKALPENTTMRYDIVISLESESLLMGNELQNRWFGGGDVFNTLVRLAPGVSAASLRKDLDDLARRNLPMEELEQNGGKMEYRLRPIRRIMVDFETVKKMIPIMSLLAVGILVLSVMNFVLLVFGTMLNRVKGLIVHKCYGAGQKDLIRMSFADSFLLLILSCVLAVVFILLVRPLFESWVAHSIEAMLNITVILPLLFLLLFILIVISFLPAVLYNRFSVTDSMQKIKLGGRKWKLILLFVQLVCSSMMLTMLYAVQHQYRVMEQSDLGYRTAGNYYIKLFYKEPARQIAFREQLSQIPGVGKLSFAAVIPAWIQSGNVVYDSKNPDNEVFTFTDLGWIDADYADIMKLTFVEGAPFKEGKSAPTDIIVSRKFADRLRNLNVIEGPVVGANITVSGKKRGNNIMTIRGVYEDIVVNSLSYPDNRPQLMNYYENYGNVLIISLTSDTQEVRQSIINLLDKEFGTGKVSLYSMEEDKYIALGSVRSFRNGIAVGGVIAVLIALIGIVGYVSNEVVRRRKELAIRKINGAGTVDILHVFIADICKVSLPAIAIGVILAYWVSEMWQAGFAVHAGLTWFSGLLCMILILLLVLSVVSLRCLQIARENPVKSIQSE